MGLFLISCHGDGEMGMQGVVGDDIDGESPGAGSEAVDIDFDLDANALARFDLGGDLAKCYGLTLRIYLEGM